MKQKLCWILLVWWFSVAVVMADQAEKEIVEALQLVGIDSQFEDLHKTIQRGLNQRRLEGVDSGALSYSQLEALIDEYFSPQLLTQQLAKSLLPEYDLNRFNLLLSSLRSEQIQGIRQRIDKTATESNLDNLHEFAKQESEPSLDDRQKRYIIEGMERASAGNELYAGVQAMATLTLLRLQEVQEGIPSQFNEEILLQQLYMDYLAQGRKATEVVYQSALEELTAEQLQLSLRVYRSTVVQWFLGKAVELMIPVVGEQRKRLLERVETASQPAST